MGTYRIKNVKGHLKKKINPDSGHFGVISLLLDFDKFGNKKITFFLIFKYTNTRPIFSWET